MLCSASALLCSALPALLSSALLCSASPATLCLALLCSAWLRLAPCSALHRLALLCSAWYWLCSSLPCYAPLCSALPVLLRSALLCSAPLGSAWHPAPFGSALLSLALFHSPPFHYYSHVPLLHDPFTIYFMHSASTACISAFPLLIIQCTSYPYYICTHV